MLTKQDLSEIKNLFQTELKVELKPIKDKLIEHDARFEQIDKKLGEHDKKFDNIDTQFKTVNKKLNKLQKDLTVTINFFDNTRIEHQKQIDRIETHLGLPTPSFT